MRTQTLVASVLLFTLLGGAAVQASTASTASTTIPHGTFQPVGNMTTPRATATATLLNDGTVLVAGGTKIDGPTYMGPDVVSQATAELYYPQTDTFAGVGPMAFSRANHAAVRLQDGRVLVVGGADYVPAPPGSVTPPPGSSYFIVGAFIATAELYDPVTRTFSPTGDLITPRTNPTATLLPNGKVLVVGGWNLDTVLTAELYDPATGKFTAAGPMILGRNGPAAILLPDGRVAILGGYHLEDGPQRSVEIYDPATDKFTAAGQMAEGRVEFQATLLPDGRILVTGGGGAPGNINGAFTTVLNSVETYDPATGQSTVTDHMTDARIDHAQVTLMDGRVLVMGGKDSQHSVASADLIDPVTGKVTPTGPMTSPHGTAVATRLQDGRVLVFGGRPRKLIAEVYVP